MLFPCQFITSYVCSLEGGMTWWGVTSIIFPLPALIFLLEAIPSLFRCGTLWWIKSEVILLLGTWKKGFFFKAGRLTLIKSFLSGIPVHFFSLFRAPCEVCKNLEKLMRDFLWEEVDEVKVKARILLDGEVIERLVALWGLDIWNLRVCNKALLAKWL